MSAIGDVFSYYASNTALTTVLPTSSFWLGIVPEKSVLPYGVLVPVSSVPSWNMTSNYYETFVFQISLYASTAAQAESLADVFKAQFDGATVTANCMACLRTMYNVIGTEQIGQNVYCALMAWNLWLSKSL